jgi:hypothetical protein
VKNYKDTKFHAGARAARTLELSGQASRH